MTDNGVIEGVVERFGSFAEARLRIAKINVWMRYGADKLSAECERQFRQKPSEPLNLDVSTDTVEPA